jgi:hypothetical protein
MSEHDANCPASSTGDQSGDEISRKPIKPPTVTPRRFRKFFTPKPVSKIHRNLHRSRKALQEITNPPGKQNHSPESSSLICRDDYREYIPPLLKGVRGSKRKLSFASIESPPVSSPLRPDSTFVSSRQDRYERSIQEKGQSAERNKDRQQESDEEDAAEDEDENEAEDEIATFPFRRDAVRPFQTLSRSSNILCSRLTGRGRRKEPKSSSIWQCETAAFYSDPKDTYVCGSQTLGHLALPFCSASCNSEH